MSQTPDIPLVMELVPPPDPARAFRAMADLRRPVFLDSALRDPRLGRYSFLAADPFEVVESHRPEQDGLSELGKRLSPFDGRRVPDLPPFQGGAAGLFSYDLGRQLERIPASAYDEFRLPYLSVGLYDVVVAFDHAQDRAWIISQGYPEQQPEIRRRRAQARAAWIRDRLNASVTGFDSLPFDGAGKLPPVELAPTYPVDGSSWLKSSLSADMYRRRIEQAIEYVRAGDVFQVNLAQRLSVRAVSHGAWLCLRLRECNPAPFSGYYDLGPVQIISASPERFLRAVDGRVEARPIKGTCERTRLPEADLFAAADLEQSEKDRAENVMIVDLLRNDLSRVCRADSVFVDDLCRLELYAFVQHLVSTVSGELADGRTALDLVRAAFPGGSVTGAPKVRAMEIIAELEPTARGAYCGSLGYLGFDGGLDLNILIRTVTAVGGWWLFSVGGGITAQSIPEREYEETWHKAKGILRAVS